MQPTHMDWCRPDRSDNWSIRVGPVRQEQAWRYRDLADAGAAIAFGSDRPIAHFDPGWSWLALNCATQCPRTISRPICPSRE